jgi:YVTN family beta-propeller protein
MKTRNTRRSLVAFAALGLLSVANISVQAADYKSIKEIPIGGEGKFDYLAVDPGARRLYVSHGNKAVVINIDTDAIVGNIADTPGIHGIAIAPELKVGFTGNGRENKASMFDLETLKTTSKIDTGANPDAILYEPGQQEVYTFNGHGNSATVIEAKTGKVVATIPLGGKPEFAVADPKANRVYNNLEDKSQIVAIDTKTHQVVNTWSIAPGEEASGMAFDPEHHRLFIGCHNKLMAMIDSTNGKVITTVPIGEGVDANAFDPGTQLAFSSNGDGTVTIAHEDSPDKLTVMQTLKTQRGARTMALDTKTHKIYLAVGSGETFKVLVYGM